jgi:hypothetical protein
MDWRPVLTRQRRHLAAMQFIFDRLNRKRGDASDVLERAGFPRRPSKVPIAVATTDDRCAGSLVENLVYDAFLILNLAGPGSCDFYTARLLGAKFENEIGLSNFNFEVALETHFSQGWPAVSVLDLGTVISWYRSVRPYPTQVPGNPMERVLFALLHMAKIELSPVTVIWQFYALESLLQTKVGENFGAIVSRLCLLLEANAAQAKLVRQRMRDLYAIRSAVVHGGFEVIHPTHDEWLDGRLDDSYGRLMNAADWGHAFLIAAVQKVINKGWRFPLFSETMTGDIVP